MKPLPRPLSQQAKLIDGCVGTIEAQEHVSIALKT